MLSRPLSRNGSLTTDVLNSLTDPLIAQARIVNDAAQIERRLEARKALRDDPHGRGWMTRRGA